MSKTQLFSLSLVGALPAAYLSFLLGMYLISQPSGASTLVMIISIITLLCTATLAVTPALVMAKYYSNYDPPRPVKPAKDKGGKDEPADADDEAEAPVKGKSKAKLEDEEELEELASSDDLESLDDSEAFETEDE